jgi:hypothetical protein
MLGSAKLRLALLPLLFTLVRGAAQLLTIGASPMELTVGTNAYVRFKIDLINDYCGKADSQARGLCMSTPYAKVKVVGCRGEAWLLTNPTKTWEPTIANAEFISKKGNETTFVELSEFSVVPYPYPFYTESVRAHRKPLRQAQSVTHIAVYNPGLNLAGEGRFQIWVENTKDPQGQQPAVRPLMRPGDQWFQLGCHSFARAVCAHREATW